MGKSIIVALVALIGLCFLQAEAKSEDPIDWPGAGKAEDWYEACQINDQANKVVEDLYLPGSVKPDRVVADKAIALYKKAIAKYPYETAFYDNLAKCYLDLGDEKQAEANYRKSVESKETCRGPRNEIRYADTYLSLARLCAKHNETKDANENFKKACRYFKSVDSFKEYANFLRTQKRLAESDRMMQEAERLEKEYAKGLKRPGPSEPSK